VVSAGARVHPGDRVYVEDKLVEPQKEKVVLAFYKPRGIVCSADGQGAKTVFEFMNYPEKLFYVGRLDKDSEGLLLLTNDGELDQAISRARNQHEKEYEVIVDHPVTRKFVQQMEKGVPILDTVTRPCKVRQKGERAFTIILTQGLNRQIRRMCEYCGYRVRRLKRVRIMNIRLGEMQPGQYRELSRQELEELRDLL
jgi:23S rRNA pseudouridine2604 synthase